MTSPILLAAPLEVDRASLLELARGGNLYTDRFAFLRELLQNAVDATLLRLFVERGSDAFPTHEGSMRALRESLAPLPIDVSITTLDEDRNGTEPMRRYRVRMEDRGMGIARRDLPHLQRIASSRKNPARATLIAAMPEWMRPSGAFGIGLQSAFLVADELTLDSRTLDGEAHTIVLRAADGGSIEVRESERAVVGTCAELVVRAPIRWRTLKGPVDRSWATHDIVRDGWIDMQLESALGLARELGAGAHVPVRVGGAPVPFLFDDDRARFDPDAGIEIVLPNADAEAMPISADEGTREHVFRFPGTRPSAGPTMYYRGAAVEFHLPDSCGLTLRANVHFGTARDLLDLGRERFVADAFATVKERVRAAVRRFGPAHLESLRARESSDALRCRTSLFLHACDASSHGDEWRALAVAKRKDGTAVPLGTLVDEESLTVVLEPMEVRLKRREAESLLVVLSSGETVRTISSQRDEHIRRFLPGIVHHDGGRSAWRREPGIHFSLDHLVEELSALGGTLRPNTIGLSDDLLVLAVRPPDRGDEYAPCWAISPWTFIDHVVDVPEPLRWIDFVVAHAATSGVAPDDVARAFVRFLRLGDPVLRARPDLTVRYDLDAAIAEICSRHPEAAGG